MEKDRRPASRAERFWAGANARGIPLQAIVATVAVVAATYLAGKLLYRLRDVVLLLLLAGFFAVLLDPLVTGLQHRGIRRRGIAVFVVTLLTVLVFAGFGAAFGYPLSHGIAHLAHAMPGYVARAEHGRGWAGHLVRQYHVAAWVHRNETKLVKFGQDLARPALTVGKGAASLLAALVTVFVLVVLLLVEGPTLIQGILNAMSPAHAERFSRLAGGASRAATGYMAGNCLTSLIAGIVVFITLLILGVPFPFMWGLWVALVDFLPQVGGALAGIPTVLFALAHSPTAGIVTAVVFAVYTQIENHVLNPVVMSKTVRVSPLFVLLSVLVGASIGGWLGGVFGGLVAALLAIPTAAALQTVIRELWRETAPDSSSPPGNGNLRDCSCPARISSLQPRLAERIWNASTISKTPRNSASRLASDDQEHRLRHAITVQRRF
jgi:predicted PurR-regulated permease PerM